MAMAVLDRFSGEDDPEGWILCAEQYFTYLGFSQKDWLPLPYFYLDGEALTWFSGCVVTSNSSIGSILRKNCLCNFHNTHIQ
ncbi:hypothetical protein KY285_033513 [Solanum tuberosum]|nr:hypothetical protein KY285_033513 [Solanum tuberosum]